MSYQSRRIKSLSDSWRSQAIGIRILRSWLGLTWIYAGWDKATDPGFLTKGSASFIGTQLSGYSTQSPIGSLFNKLIEHSTAVGIAVMLAEFAIGLATLLWVSPTFAAFGGFTMSVGLWLASSFHVSPYFLASDSAYAILWLVYFLTLVGNRRTVDVSLDRRGAIRVGALAGAAIGLSLLGKAFPKSSAKAVATKTSSGSAVKILALSKIAVGQTHQFALSNGAPAVLFRTNNGVFAYSAVCTHQGCTVAYKSSNKTLHCPCHGAEFDPFANGKAVQGPARDPLSAVKVKIEGNWVVLA
jgi:thiosulfate dehydrogenase [quinone] large subunit